MTKNNGRLLPLFFQRVKELDFNIDTLMRRTKKSVDLVKTISSAYIGTVESVFAESEEIP